MASIAVVQADVYSLVAQAIETGIPDLESGDFYLALFGDNFVFDPAHVTWADIKADEIDDVGYTSGGKEVVFDVSRTDYDDTTGIWTFGPNCDPLEWDNADFTTDPVHWGVLYEYVDDEGSPDDGSVLVCAYKLTTPAEPDDEKFRWNFNAGGLVKWTAKFVAPA